MKTELQEKLFNKYPHFFEYLKNNNDSIILPMQFGIECGDGWYFLINRLMENITQHMNYYNNNEIIKNKILRYIFNWDFFLFKILGKFKYGRKFVIKCLTFSRKFEVTKPKPIQVDILQIKEKFGGLRFYINGGDDYINNIISFTENLSYYTCEKCGTQKNVGRTNGWIYTLCEDCIKGNNLEHTWKKLDI